jgi:hypothetical protein
MTINFLLVLQPADTSAAIAWKSELGNRGE